MKNGELTFLEWLRAYKFIRRKDYDELDDIEQNMLYDEYERFLQWEKEIEY